MTQLLWDTNYKTSLTFRSWRDYKKKALGKILHLPLLAVQYHDIALAFRYTLERKHHVPTVTMNLIVTVLMMKMKTLTSYHHLSLDLVAAPHCREEFLIHRLSLVFGSAGGVRVPSILVQMAISNIIFHPNLRHLNKRKTELMQINYEEACLIWLECQAQQQALWFPLLLYETAKVLIQTSMVQQMGCLGCSQVYHPLVNCSRGSTVWVTSQYR